MGYLFSEDKTGLISTRLTCEQGGTQAPCFGLADLRHIDQVYYGLSRFTATALTAS